MVFRFLATGDSYFSIANSYYVGVTTVFSIIQEVLPLIWTILQPVVMLEPDKEALLEIADNYWQKWNIPNCLGSIDGKHVKITAPPNSGSLYFNYKHHFSIVLMGVCDADYNFLYVDIGAYGSLSDGGVFSNSEFGVKLKSNRLPIPQARPLPGSATMCQFYFVGDAAFPLGAHLMKPYSGRMLGIEKSVFNYRLSRARRVIENTFGILAARWRIFHRSITALPSTVDNVIKATVCLHNFVRKASALSKERYTPPFYTDSENSEGQWREEATNSIFETCPRLSSNNATFNAISQRDALAKYFLTPAGFKRGQIEYVTRK